MDKLNQIVRSLFTTLFFLTLGYPSWSQNTLIHDPEQRLLLTAHELYFHEKYAPGQFYYQELAKSQSKGTLTQIEAGFLEAIGGLVLFQANAPSMVADFVATYPGHPLAYKASFEAANYWFSKKDYGQAITFYNLCNEKYLKDDEIQDLHFRLAYAYFNKKDFTNASQRFDKLKASKNKYTYAASYYSGFIAYKLGNYTVALQDLVRAKENEAYKPLVPYMLVNVWYKMKKYDDIISYKDTLTQKIPTAKNIEDIQFLVGEAYFQKQNFKKAAEFFFGNTAPQNVTYSSDVAYRLAYTKYMVGDLDAAILQFKKLAEANDTTAHYASYYLGLSYLKKQNKPFATQAFNQARNMKFLPKYQEQAAFYYGKLLFENENYAEAIPALKYYFTLAGSEKNDEASELLGEAYLNNNDYEDAVQYIEKLSNKTLKTNGVYQKVTFVKGMQLFNQEAYPEAIEYFEKSLKSPMDNILVADASFWIGECYSIGKRWDDALIYYQKMHRTKLAEKSTFYASSLYGMGYAYFNTKDFGKASVSFKEFLKTSGTSTKDRADATIRLGDCLYALKKYNEAIVQYENALEMSRQDNDYVLYQKGVVYDAMAKFDEAIQNFRKVVSLYAPSPYFEPSFFSIGQIYFEQGNYQGSVNQFTEFIKSFPTSAKIPDAYLKRAIAFTNLKQPTEALGDYKFVIENYPQTEAAQASMQSIQEVLVSTGQQEEFSSILTKYKELNPSASGLENLEYENAKTLYFDQKYEKAIVLFSNLLKDYGSGKHAIEANYYLADCYYRIGKPDLAQTYYQVVLDAGPTTAFYTKALQKSAEGWMTTKSYEQAGVYFKKLLSAASNKKEFYFAYAGLMQVEFERKNADSAIFYANKVLEKGNISANATNKAHLCLVKSYLAKADTNRAIDYILYLKNAAKDENAAEAQFLLAKIQFGQKQYRPSLETLFDLNENFSVYSKWIGQGFLLIGDNYAALKEFYQAKSTLKSLADNFPDKAIVEQAIQKINQIDALEKGEMEDGL